MSETAERTARSSAEAAQLNSERILSSSRSGTDAANRIAEQSLTKYSNVFGLTCEAARQNLQRSFGNMQAMLDTSTILADGLHDLAREWRQFLQDRAEQNLDHLGQMLGCRSFQEWIALQTQITRDRFQTLLETAKRASERTTQVAEQAFRRMSETTLAPR